MSDKKTYYRANFSTSYTVDDITFQEYEEGLIPEKGDGKISIKDGKYVLVVDRSYVSDTKEEALRDLYRRTKDSRKEMNDAILERERQLKRAVVALDRAREKFAKFEEGHKELAKHLKMLDAQEK